MSQPITAGEAVGRSVDLRSLEDLLRELEELGCEDDGQQTPEELERERRRQAEARRKSGIPKPPVFVLDGLSGSMRKAHAESRRFADHVVRRERDRDGRIKRRWLTLAGTCGCGKTLLARWVEYTARLNGMRPVWVDCSTLAERMKHGEPMPAELFTASLVILDDFGAWHDTTGFCASQFRMLLNRRLDRWTLITTNATLGQLKEMDARLPWRFMAGESNVVDLFSAPCHVATKQTV